MVERIVMNDTFDGLAPREAWIHKVMISIKV